MRTPRFRPSSFRRRKDRSRKIIPLLEVFEERCLMTGFLQGTVVDNSNNPVLNATVDLYNSSAMLVGSQTTGLNGYSNGYYQFDNLTPGNYQLVEIPPTGYTNLSTSSDSPINPILAGGTASTVNVQVTDVTDPAPNNFTSVTFKSADFFAQNGNSPLEVNFQINKNFNNANPASYASEQLFVAQLPITTTYTGTPGFTTPEFSSYCADPFQGLNDGVNTYSVLGQEMPPALNVTTVTPNILNSGRIAYLYNTFANYVESQYSTNPELMGGLQLAIWKLEFDPETGTAAASDFSSGNLENVTPQAGYSTAAQVTTMINDAVNFINDSSSQSQLAVYLGVTGAGFTSKTSGSQGVLASSTITFTNQQSQQASSSVSTAIHDSGGGPVTGALGEQVYDTATVTGTPFTPTGTVTYEFFSTINGTGPLRPPRR